MCLLNYIQIIFKNLKNPNNLKSYQKICPNITIASYIDAFMDRLPYIPVWENWENYKEIFDPYKKYRPEFVEMFKKN